MTELISRYPILSECENEIKKAADALIRTFENGGKLLVCGNGGSAADSEHIVGELMKGFMYPRALTDEKKAALKQANPSLSDSTLNSLQGALPAISLTSHPSFSSAFANDAVPSLVFAQQLYALGRHGDIFLGITTSGSSKNVCEAAEIAKALGITVIALTGRSGGRLRGIADICIRVPEDETYKVQELHLPVYHFLCAETEKHFFG